MLIHTPGPPARGRLRKRVLRTVAPFWTGSRSSLRRAVERFMRPFRDTADGLARIARLLAAPAALFALVAALAGPAMAAPSDLFVEHTGSANPLNGIDLTFTRIFSTIADVDNDGDLDFVVQGNQNYDGSDFLFIENTGTAQAPLFVRRTGAANPFDGISRITPLGLSAAEFGDFDNDGDLDMVCTDSTFITTFFRYFENDGSGGFAEQTGTASPFDGLTTTMPFSNFLIISDLDSDGDLDVLVQGLYGYEGSDLLFVKNSGTAEVPSLALLTGSSNPFNGFVFGSGVPSVVVDLDDDGDLDVAHAELDIDAMKVHYFENLGGHNLVRRTGTANPFNGIALEDFATFFTLSDIDNDGDFDMMGQGIYATDGSSILLVENTGTAQVPAFAEQTGTANPFDGFGFDAVINGGPGPHFGDFDDDGDLDYIIGTYGSNYLYTAFRYFENTAISGVPANSLTDSWVDFGHTGNEQGTEANPFNTVGKGVTALVDDGSGTLHIKAGSSSETLSISKPMTVRAEGGAATIGQPL